jgi:hypothetical protein
MVPCPKLSVAEALSPVRWVQTELPRTVADWDAVLIFQEGKQVAAFKLDPKSKVVWRTSLSLANPTPSQVASAQQAAQQDYEKALKGWNGGRVRGKTPEPLVCAVVSNEEARSAFLKASAASNSAAWAYHDTLDASARADDKTLTSAERAKLRRDAGDKAAAHKQDRDEERDAIAKLKAIAASYKPGCLADLSRNVASW